MDRISEKYIIHDENYQGEETGPKSIVYQSRPKVGERFGSLVIPKLNLKLPLVEGTGTKELPKVLDITETLYCPMKETIVYLLVIERLPLNERAKLKKVT